MPEIHPVEHASFTMKWGDISIGVDPVGDAARYGHPSLLLVTDIHSDHFDVAALSALNAPIIAPQAVVSEMPEELQTRATVLKNGASVSFGDYVITAFPMYNLPSAANAEFHPKGRGNGYVVEHQRARVYIAGDTAGIPEMRSLSGIDLALMPMNLPYTMSVEEAAGATLSFKPRVVVPYHYRGPDGLADVAQFKRLVETSDPRIRVELMKWYA